MKTASKDKSGDDYFTMAISSPRKRCPKCGHRTGGTRFVRVKRKDGEQTSSLTET